MNIKRCREQAGKSVAEVAEYMEVSSVAAYKWERGKNMPSADKLLKLAKYLDCTVEDLLSKEQKPAEDTTGERREDGQAKN